MRYIEKAVLLQTLDYLWREHLVTLEHLRQAVSLRGYAQRDPLNEYKSESFQLFSHMLSRLRRDVTGQIMHVSLAPAADAQEEFQDFGDLPEMHAHHLDASTGEDEFQPGDGVHTDVEAGAPGSRETGKRPRSQGRSERGEGAARAQSERSRNLGEGFAQRPLPLRFRQEVQALPWRHRFRRRGVAARTASSARQLRQRSLSHGERDRVRGDPPVRCSMQCARVGCAASGRIWRYFAGITWPRISPLLCSAVCTLTYNFPLCRAAACASVSFAEPSMGLAGFSNLITTAASLPGSAGP